MRIRVVLIVTFLTAVMCLMGQGWPRIIADSINSQYFDLDEDYDNGILITGTIHGNPYVHRYGWIIKTDVNGNVLWDKRFGDGTYMVCFSSLYKTFDGGMIISGSTNLVTGTHQLSMLFIKLNACAEIEWCSFVLENSNNYCMYASHIVQLSDSSYISLINCATEVDNIRMKLLKLSRDGIPLWKKPIPLDTLVRAEGGQDMLVTDIDKVLISGNCHYSLKTRPYFIMSDADGEILWDLKWEEPDFYTAWIEKTINGSGDFYYSAGSAWIYDRPKPLVPILYKFDGQGNQIQYTYLIDDTTKYASSNALCILEDTNVIVSYDWSDDQQPGDTNNFAIIHTDTLGNYINSRELIEANSFFPSKMITTFDQKALAIKTLLLDVNQDIYLWKLNRLLQDDSIYSQPFTYDSLCPYPILIDTLDLDCGLFTNLEDIPLKSEFDKVIKLYPNPSSGDVYFDGIDLKYIKQVRIYNHVGQLVFNQAFTSNRLDVSNLKTGLYIVELDTDIGIFRKKIIIK